MPGQPLFYTTYRSELGNFYLVKSSQGICFISSPQNGQQEIAAWAEKHVSLASLIENDKVFTIEKQQLAEYFTRKRNTFSFPFDIIGTPFQQNVWKNVRTIPYGETRTYTDIAEMIGNQNAVRAVASAIAKNPLLIVIPCHRIVHKQKQTPRYRAGASFKQCLLTLERFDA